MNFLLLRLLTGLGDRAEKDLIEKLLLQVQFLKAEAKVLRSKLPERITVTPAERRRLVELGKLLGAAIAKIITIVSPRTFARWLNGEKKLAKVKEKAGPGRPRKPEEVRELVVRLAKENAWGSVKILGELKKLGVHDVCRTTVRNILKENGFDPGPKRGEGTWHDFVKRHADSLWACDFFTKNVWTMNGLVQFYVLFFIHIGTRRVHIAGMTANPDNAWMVQQARNLSMHFDGEKIPPKYLVLDNDSKFIKGFAEILESEDIELIHTPIRSPNMNPFAERWVLSIKSECLDHFIVFGEAHLRHIINEYVKFYNIDRPHQGIDNRPIPDANRDDREAPILPFPEKVECSERLGGLLKSYRRAAACVA